MTTQTSETTMKAITDQFGDKWYLTSLTGTGAVLAVHEYSDDVFGWNGQIRKNGKWTRLVRVEPVSRIGSNNIAAEEFGCQAVAYATRKDLVSAAFREARR